MSACKQTSAVAGASRSQRPEQQSSPQSSQVADTSEHDQAASDVPRCTTNMQRHTDLPVIPLLSCLLCSQAAHLTILLAKLYAGHARCSQRVSPRHVAQTRSVIAQDSLAAWSRSEHASVTPELIVVPACSEACAQHSHTSCVKAPRPEHASGRCQMKINSCSII